MDDHAPLTLLDTVLVHLLLLTTSVNSLDAVIEVVLVRSALLGISTLYDSLYQSMLVPRPVARNIQVPRCEPLRRKSVDTLTLFELLLWIYNLLLILFLVLFFFLILILLWLWLWIA